jgi:hypothetical protein
MEINIAIIALGYCLAVLITGIVALVHWNFFEPQGHEHGPNED